MPKEDTQFKKGQSGNPNGRPKGSCLNLTTLLKSKLEEVPEGKQEAYKDLFIKTLLHKALIEKDLQSLKLIINYVDGLLKQSMDIVMSEVTDERVIQKVEGVLDNYFNGCKK